MFQVVARHWKLIFFLLTSPKCDMSKVEKAIFEGLVSHLELIFGILIIPKCDLVEVEKSIFELHLWHFQHISGLGLSRNATWVLSKERLF